MSEVLKWNRFYKDLGSDQELPPYKKPVLVRLHNNKDHLPNPVVMGYLKFGGGDKDCPYFVTPGCDFGGEPYLWCDCLPYVEFSEYFKVPPKVDAEET